MTIKKWKIKGLAEYCRYKENWWCNHPDNYQKNKDGKNVCKKENCPIRLYL